MHDVTCLGELLIDFTSLKAGVSLIETPGFLKHAGGGPANVSVGVSRLGGQAAFLGMVGNDEFGRFLEKTLADTGVNTRGLRFSGNAHTTLAFVALREDGEREFVFYRNPGADMLYGPDDLDEELVTHGKILHHGTISFISEPNREATLRAIDLAKAAGSLISFDPNVRMNLWNDPLAAHEAALLGLLTADIVKLSEEELEFITMQTDLQRGLRLLRERGIPAVVVTRGERGCAYAWGDYTGEVCGRNVTALDTTGAGDAFVASLLYHLANLDKPPTDFTHNEIRDSLIFANAAAALVVTRHGAIPAMPSMPEVLKTLGEG